MSVRDTSQSKTQPASTHKPQQDRRNIFIAPTATLRPMVPDVPRVNRALEQAVPLASLLQRLQASQACLAAVKTCLPPALAAHVKAGPLDDEGWTLVAANAAVSAKLRQLQPRLATALADQGLKVNAIRVKVSSQ